MVRRKRRYQPHRHSEVKHRSQYVVGGFNGDPIALTPQSVELLVDAMNLGPADTLSWGGPGTAFEWRNLAFDTGALFKGKEIENSCAVVWDATGLSLNNGRLSLIKGDVSLSAYDPDATVIGSIAVSCLEVILCVLSAERARARGGGLVLVGGQGGGVGFQLSRACLPELPQPGPPLPPAPPPLLPAAPPAAPPLPPPLREPTG